MATVSLAAMASGIRGKVFFGWWIVLAGVCLSILQGGIYIFGISAYWPSLTREFGWSRVELAGVNSIGRIEGGFGPLFGFAVDRFGPRRVTAIGMFLMGLGFILMSRVDSLLMYYVILAGIFPLASSLGGGIGARTAAANWFVRHRGLAMGSLLAGFGLGTLLLPGVTWVIFHYGWRTAAVVSGLASWAIGIPLALLLRHKPEPYGYRPDGEPPVEAVPAVALRTAAEPATQVDFTPKEAIRTRAFWLLGLAWTFWAFLPAITTAHMLPFLNELGLGPQVAALAVGSYGLFSAVFRVVLGWAGDHYGRRFILVSCWLLQVLGLFLLANIHAAWQVIPFILVFGPGYGGVLAQQGALQADFFGRKYFGTISGILQLLNLASGIVGPVLIAWFYDNRGGVAGYREVFMLMAALNIIGAVAVFAARPPKRRQAPSPRVAPV